MKLRDGYIVTGIITGLILLSVYIWTLPDGKLHITFCNVGQGDAAYIRFPDGRDILVDGGPNDKVLDCLGKYMPFWDRHLSAVIMTHPQKDHMQGLIPVVERLNVGYFIRSDIQNPTQGYTRLLEVIEAKGVPVKNVTAGNRVIIGSATLTLLWPDDRQIAKSTHAQVAGATTAVDVNDYSLVFLLTYGMFDALFTGDADSQNESLYPLEVLAGREIEVLKFPHHGSKTAMSDDYLSFVSPEVSIISVGKNTYGHPAPEALDRIVKSGSGIFRTDEDGDISIVTDGTGWKIIQ